MDIPQSFFKFRIKNHYNIVISLQIIKINEKKFRIILLSVSQYLSL